MSTCNITRRTGPVAIRNIVTANRGIVNTFAETKTGSCMTQCVKMDHTEILVSLNESMERREMPHSR